MLFKRLESNWPRNVGVVRLLKGSQFVMCLFLMARLKLCGGTLNNIQSNSPLLQLKLNDWWLSKVSSPCFKEVLSFVPVCICWELWRARNNSRYDGVPMEYRLISEGCLMGCIFLLKGVIRMRSGLKTWGLCVMFLRSINV